MNASKLAAAITEAERFLAKAETVARSPARQYGTESHHQTSPKHTGAVRRASMDLTRALAELRKPN